jgi:hypothetical protein
MKRTPLESGPKMLAIVLILFAFCLALFLIAGITSLAANFILDAWGA